MKKEHEVKRRVIDYATATAAELEDFNHNPNSIIELRFRSIAELDAYEKSQEPKPKRKERPKKRSPRKRKEA